MTDRLTKAALQTFIGVTADGVFGPRSKAALSAKFSNKSAPAITEDQFRAAGERLGVPVAYMKGSRKIEAPRGAFDDDGRPSILYERHKFRNNTVPIGRFNASNPALSGPPYGHGGYGPFGAQWGKLADACALDPEAAFRACSWGAFQVLGENAVAMGYSSAFDMAYGLVADEAAHLETYVRFIETNHLIDELRACRPNDPNSCIPFVSKYNGDGFRQNNYHVNFAHAIAG